MTAFEDLSGPFQVPLHAAFRANPTGFITARTWKDLYKKADLVWNVDHSCYQAFGLGPAGYPKGQTGLEQRGAILLEKVRAEGVAVGTIPLRNGRRLELRVTDHPALRRQRPHIGYRITCHALGWVDKKWSGGVVREDMLYDPEVRYADGQPHVVAPWLTVQLVKE
jgi:hypothetical protein